MSKPPRIVQIPHPNTVPRGAPSRFTPAHDASLHRYGQIKADTDTADDRPDTIVDNPEPKTPGGWPLPM